MKAKITNNILEKYPEINIGVVVAKDLDNTKDNSEIQELMRETEKQTREKFEPEKVAEIPVIAKWREIYKSFGAKPSKFRNSVEALIKRVLRGDQIYKINPLVDIYNLISVKHIMTVGGEDLEKLQGDLVLDFAKGDEQFIPLGSEENDAPWEEEVIYKDDAGAICRCWNYREADRTKLTKDTKNAVIVIENPLGDNEFLDKALEELKQLIEKYCQGDCEIKILNNDNPGVEI